MKELSCRFSPQAEVRIYVTETMQQDFKGVRRCFGSILMMKKTAMGAVGIVGSKEVSFRCVFVCCQLFRRR